MMKKIIPILVSFLSATALFAQKGQSSLSVGPLVSFPLDRFPGGPKTGIGLEANGQYGVSPKSNLVVQTALIHYPSDHPYYKFSVLNLKAGYRYQFGASGVYLNGLGGAEMDLSDGFTSVVFTLGGGKRFTFHKGRQLDIGVDFLAGDTWVHALSIKAALLLFKKQRTQQ